MLDSLAPSLSVPSATARASVATRSRRWLTLAVLAGLLTLSGCTKTGTVNGSVTLDGQPVLFGQVAFTGPNGKSVSAPIRNGKFTLSKVPLGAGTFTVNTQEVQAIRDELSRQEGNLPPGVGVPNGAAAPAGDPQAAQHRKDMEEMATKGVLVPLRYTDPAQSGLKYTVTGGDQTFDLPLKSQGQ